MDQLLKRIESLEGQSKGDFDSQRTGEAVSLWVAKRGGLW